MKLSLSLCSALGHACQIFSLDNACVTPSGPVPHAPVMGDGEQVAFGTVQGLTRCEPAAFCLDRDLQNIAGETSPALYNQSSNALPAFPACSWKGSWPPAMSCQWHLPQGACPTAVHGDCGTLPPSTTLRKTGEIWCPCNQPLLSLGLFM